MKIRTRILPKMLNSEVGSYLEHNDLIIVPVGTVEMHGGLPLDCETVISEAVALRMAEAADGLVLTGLPYFYAGATASGRGTVQCSVRQGIDYLGAIARSLLRQGFRRQIYISFHGPAHMTCSPMVRDFFDETGVPVLYMDLTMQLLGAVKGSSVKFEDLNDIFVGAYQIMGRLEDVPLVTGYQHTDPQTVASFQDIFRLAYQSGSVGYCFGAQKDHAPTPDIPTAQRRQEMADHGEAVINELVEHMDVPAVAEKLRELDRFEQELMERFPWMPAAWNTK